MISHNIFSICPAGLAIWHDFWMMVLLLGLGGICNALFNNALPALYYKVLGEKNRGMKLGVSNASVLTGYGLWPLISGFLISSSNMNAVFMFSCTGLLLSLAFSSFLPDVPGTAVRLSDYRADLSNKSVLIFIMLVFAFSLHAGAEQSSFSLFLNKDIKLIRSALSISYTQVLWLYWQDRQ